MLENMDRRLRANIVNLRTMIIDALQAAPLLSITGDAALRHNYLNFNMMRFQQAYNEAWAPLEVLYQWIRQLYRFMLGRTWRLPAIVRLVGPGTGYTSGQG